jgi:hypothetical protein
LDYQLIAGTTVSRVMADLDSGHKKAVLTSGGSVTSSGGRFLVYYDSSTATTWAIVLDGAATANAGGAKLDIPAGFLTWFSDGGVPAGLQSAYRANLVRLQLNLPAIEDLTGAVLTDADVLIGPEPVATDMPSPDITPTPLPNNVTRLPKTATLTAGKTTVWYVPQAVGTLDTLQLADTRQVSTGDGVNVSDDGRADLNFQDALKVEIYRHSQLAMDPSFDPTGAIPSLYYDLTEGTTLNTVSSSVWSRLQDARIGVRASGWATITAVYTSHRAAEGALTMPLPGLGPNEPSANTRDSSRRFRATYHRFSKGYPSIWRASPRSTENPALVIAERTAERHVENILGKLGLERRTQIGVWAAQQGLTAFEAQP